jgi:hypothetical protein
MTDSSRLGLAQPATYRIEVEGRLREDWPAPIDGLIVTVSSRNDGPDVTTITGTLADQAALHGLLAYIRDLGVPLLSVDCIDRPRAAGRTRR